MTEENNNNQKIKEIRLSQGEEAPDFTGKTDKGNDFTLRDCRGKNLVLYFYPKNNTPGCTMQAKGFGEKFDEIEQMGSVVIGISRDTQASHEKFCNRYNLPFTLISDEDGEICQKYGVLQQRKMFGYSYLGINRSTFIINKKGIIEHAWYNVSVLKHAEKVVDALSVLK